MKLIVDRALRGDHLLYLSLFSVAHHILMRIMSWLCVTSKKNFLPSPPPTQGKALFGGLLGPFFLNSLYPVAVNLRWTVFVRLTSAVPCAVSVLSGPVLTDPHTHHPPAGYRRAMGFPRNPGHCPFLGDQLIRIVRKPHMGPWWESAMNRNMIYVIQCPWAQKKNKDKERKEAGR